MNVILHKTKKKLRSYYRRAYYLAHGLYFDYVLKTYQTDGFSFVIPKAYTSRITRGYFAEGNVEPDERHLVKKHLDPAAIVLELGANIGVVSGTINRRLTNPEKQVVVEANPTLIPYLEENRQNNRCAFRIENRVVSEEKEIPFFFGHSISSGGIVEKNAHNNQAPVMVQGITLPDLQDKYQLTFDTLIMDIEGAEYQLLQDIKISLSQFKLILFEQHPAILTEDQQQKINSLLTQGGLTLVDQSGDTVAWKRT